jgi:hypothetical protein
MDIPLLATRAHRPDRAIIDRSSNAEPNRGLFCLVNYRRTAV